MSYFRFWSTACLAILGVVLFSTISFGQLKLDQIKRTTVQSTMFEISTFENILGAIDLGPPSETKSVALLEKHQTSCNPFFCRIEDEVADKAGLPIRFRLGEASYVDRLEQKYSVLDHERGAVFMGKE